MLSLSYVDNPGDYVGPGVYAMTEVSPGEFYSGDWHVEIDTNLSGFLDAGDKVAWQGGTAPVANLTFGTDAFGTIQEVIAAAFANDTIYVAQGSYSEYLTINKSLTLQGDGAAGTTQTILQGDGI